MHREHTNREAQTKKEKSRQQVAILGTLNQEILAPMVGSQILPFVNNKHNPIQVKSTTDREDLGLVDQFPCCPICLSRRQRVHPDRADFMIQQVKKKTSPKIADFRRKPSGTAWDLWGGPRMVGVRWLETRWHLRFLGEQRKKKRETEASLEVEVRRMKCIKWDFYSGCCETETAAIEH